MVAGDCMFGAGMIYIYGNIKSMATSPQMTDLSWVSKLERTKPSARYTFQAIHVCAQLRGTDGVAPVVLQTTSGYTRSPIALEAAFEVIL